ncbi:MAG: signal transduction histidine kinase, partial [Candidatus Latescibacterota bacterium]
KRALFNLMKNAVQAMRHGGQLQVRAQMVEGEVLIEVVDNGPGIAEEVRARLFEPFFTTREKGSGLGLAVVSQTVEENGGRLELQSTQGEGTTVCVHLPSIDRVGHVEIEQGG